MTEQDSRDRAPSAGGAPDLSALGLPTEDVGAETQARFRYQAEVAARHCVEMLVDDRVVAVICEWFEDYLVVFADDRIVMASVKHREGTRGPWRLGELASAALASLFNRWVAASKRPDECRLVTNGSLASGPSEAAALREACNSLDSDKLDEFANGLARKIGGSPDDTRAFLGVLSLESDIPGRLDIGLNTVEHQVRPALRALDLADSAAPQVYEALVGLAEAAGRATRGARVSTYRVINEPAAIRRELEQDALLRERTLTRLGVQAAAHSAVSDRPPALVPRRSVSRSSVMVQKLQAGGFGPTQIGAAQRLRGIWYETEARFRVGLPGSDDDIEDLRTRVLALAGEAEGIASSSVAVGGTYGTRMHATLATSLQHMPASTNAGVRLDSLHLQGLVYQLTDECLVWWSPEFETSV